MGIKERILKPLWQGLIGLRPDTEGRTVEIRMRLAPRGEDSLKLPKTTRARIPENPTKGKKVR